MSDPFDPAPRLPPPPPPSQRPFQSPNPGWTPGWQVPDAAPSPVVSGSTSGKARAAMILGLISIVAFATFVVPVLALVFGLIGLAEVRRGRRGKRMAVTGIVLGALGIIGFAIVIVVAVNKEIDQRITSIADLEVGTCYDIPNASTGQVQIADIEEVDCAASHTGEAFYTGRLDASESYPGETEVQLSAGRECIDEPWTEYLGSPYPGDYELYTLYPQKLAWKVTRGAFACLVIDPNLDDLVGSVRDG